MKRFTCSLAAAGVFGLAPLAAADSLHEAFSNGTVAGQVAAYGQWSKEKGGEREGFVSGSAALEYKTAPFKGFSAGLGAWGTTRLHEKNDGDYRASIERDAIIHQAYLHYERSGLGEITAGRHEIDLEWLNDYILGVTASLTPVENLAVTFGWAGRQAAVGLDKVSDGFAKMNGSRGLYFVDFNYTPLEWLTVNPYYYHASDLFRAPGLKLTAEYEPMAGLDSATMLQFVKTNNPSGQDNGSFVWLEQQLAWGDFGFSGGYMRAGSNGVGGIDSFGDQSPFEEGVHIYDPEAKTWYLGLEYGYGELSLAALYGQTRYDAGGRTKEFNLVAGYPLYDNLELELIYADVRNRLEPDYRTFSLALVYAF